MEKKKKTLKSTHIHKNKITLELVKQCNHLISDIIINARIAPMID